MCNVPWNALPSLPRRAVVHLRLLLVKLGGGYARIQDPQTEQTETGLYYEQSETIPAAFLVDIAGDSRVVELERLR